MPSDAWSKKKWLPEPKITQIFHIVEPWADTLATSTSGVANFQSSSVLTWIGNDLFNHAALANFPSLVSKWDILQRSDVAKSLHTFLQPLLSQWEVLRKKSLWPPLHHTICLSPFLGLIADSGDWMLKQQCWVPTHTLPTPLRTKLTGINDQI